MKDTTIVCFGAMVITILINRKCLCLTRLPCKFYADFSVILNNTIDSGTALKTVSSGTVRECALECLSWPTCRSLNFNIGTKTCHLLERSLNESIALLRHGAGQVYLTTDDGKSNKGPVCSMKSPCENGAMCEDTCDSRGYKCTCSHLYYGTHCERLKQGCGDVKRSGETTSGMYEIKPDPYWKTIVYCDFIYGSQDWIVFQRRINGSVDFYRDWASYKSGFGNPRGNFWIGLDTLHRLAAPGRGAILRVDLKHYNSPSTLFYAEYSAFEVGDEASGYRLALGTYAGNAGDAMTVHNGMKFSTYDRENDRSRGHCARIHKGGWWFNACYKGFLNGLHPLSMTNAHQYSTWVSTYGTTGDIIFSEMKLKFYK